MDPVGNANPGLDALRRQMAENIERMRESGKLAGAPSRRAGQPHLRAEALEAIVQRRISAIDRRSSGGKARAACAFVESVLVAEFGEARLVDPAFARMLVEIGDSLRQDPQTRDQLDDLLGEF